MSRTYRDRIDRGDRVDRRHLRLMQDARRRCPLCLSTRSRCACPED